VHVLVEIELLVIIGMNGHKERRPALDSLDDGVDDTCLQVVARGEEEVEVCSVAQLLDVLLCVVDVAEAAREDGGDGTLDPFCGQACSLCMGMLVCGCSKGCHGDGMSWGRDDLRLM
jgi:hypothetical protein